MGDTDSLSFTCRLRGYQINEGKLRIVAQAVLDALGLADWELSLQLVGSTAIRRLNLTHRGIDKATDVLSFPQETWKVPVKVRSAPGTTKRRPSSLPPRTLGDIVISLPDAARNAAKIGQPLDREVAFLVVHGILHLGGHDHMKKVDEDLMLKAQRALMTKLEQAPNTKKPLWDKSVKRRSRGRR